MRSDLNLIKAQLKRQLPFLRKDFDVKHIGIFGSLVKGTAKSNSDVDILVHFSSSPGLFKFVELETYLSHILKLKVDLVTKNSLKKTIKDEILHEVTYV